MSRWLEDAKRQEEKRRKQVAFDMFSQCRTEDEIAKAVGVSRTKVTGWSLGDSDLVRNGHLSESDKNSAVYGGLEWFPYNVWTGRSLTNATRHPGNTEQEFTDRLVRAYTAPFDVVIDPFGGGGATLDVCRKRSRRCLISDLAPIASRKHEIRQHDVTTGLLKPPQWKDVKLVYLDPPYWCQKEYGGGETDLSAMDVESFHDALYGVISGYAGRVPSGCRIALIIQPTQWKAPGRAFTDHMAEMLRRVKLPVEQRIQAPYQTQQCQPQQVEWAKQELQWLVLSREITVWRKP